MSHTIYMRTMCCGRRVWECQVIEQYQEIAAYVGVEDLLFGCEEPVPAELAGAEVERAIIRMIRERSTCEDLHAIMYQPLLTALQNMLTACHENPDTCIAM